jgi:hypothetical protein
MLKGTIRPDPDASHLSMGDEGRTEYFQMKDGDRVQRMAKFNLAYPKWLVPRGRRSNDLRQLGAETSCGWMIAYTDAVEGLILEVVLRDGWEWDEQVSPEECERRGMRPPQTRCDLLVHDIAKNLMESWKRKASEVSVRLTPLENERHYFEYLLPRGSA